MPICLIPMICGIFALDKHMVLEVVREVPVVLIFIRTMFLAVIYITLLSVSIIPQVILTISVVVLAISVVFFLDSSSYINSFLANGYDFCSHILILALITYLVPLTILLVQMVICMDPMTFRGIIDQSGGGYWWIAVR